MSIENTPMDSYIRTFTGRKFWPLNPNPDDVAIEDIAHALAYKCRYNGHTDRFYSVAEHSYRVSLFCTKPNRLVGLLHDAAEAYLPDVPRPIKPHLPGFKELERKIDRAIAVHFGTPYPFPEEVHVIDYSILTDEMREMLNYGDGPYGPPLYAHTDEFGWRPKLAERQFLRKFSKLIEEN